MKKYLLYGHGGAYNHGAEAIVRSTIALLREEDSQAEILLSTHFPEQDREFGLDKLAQLIPADLSLVPEEKAQTTYETRCAVARKIYRDALSVIDADTVCIAVGGDNYCYPNWHRQSVFHDTAKESGASSILWGCSIQPESIDERMEAVLRGHDHIYARESLTEQALLERGIMQVTRQLDPAFQLKPVKTPLPEGFSAGHTVAINLSPLMLRRSEGLMEIFVETARVLFKHTEKLLLLPHVTMSVDDDREALRELETRLTKEERSRLCHVPDGLGAQQLKYLVSRCEALVCCRTHASIAGYSTGVPTLVAGYSVKSKGIALDLDMDQWIVPMDMLHELPNKATMFIQKRKEIQRSLADRGGSM